MKVRVDENKCIGCGICANLCPKGIEMVNGRARIKNENVVCLKDAARVCPRNCIIIDGDDKGEVKIENTRARFNPRFGQGRGIGRGQGKGRMDKGKMGGRGRRRSRGKW